MDGGLRGNAETVPSPWASTPFRWLLLGRTVSSLGSAISPVALALAVLQLGGSATELGLVVAAYALLDVVTTLFAGVLGDRVSRTSLMRGSAALAGASQAVVALSLIAGWANLPWLAGMSALNGALAALAGPSSRAVLPQTVPAATLTAAVPLLRLATNTTMVAGFGVAGVLVAAFGSGWAIAVDAATFGVAAACFAVVRVERTVVPAAPSMLGELRSGASEIFRHPWLWVLIGQALGYHLVYGGAQGVLGPIVVTRAFGAAAWGWALACLMGGFMVGGVIALRYRPHRMLFAGTAFLALTACFPLALALDLNLTVVLVGAFIHGLGLEIFSVNWDLAIQQNVPADKLARVFAFDQLGSFVMRPLGLALTGPVAEAVGERRWLLVTAAVMVVITAAALISRSVRELRRQS